MYAVRDGKFGKFFVEVSKNNVEKALSLQEVSDILNNKKDDSAEFIGKKVVVYNRYLFAVPVKGTIIGVSTKDGAFQVNFDEGQPGGSNVNAKSGSYFFREECRVIVTLV